MKNHERILLNTILRRDLVSFIHRCFQTIAPGERFFPNWHIQAIAHHLAQCLMGRTNRLLITLPPRCLRSICASVAFPAWALGHDPTHQIVCASYAHDLSAKHARDCRAIMEAPWYQELFPQTRIADKKNTESEFITTERGSLFSTSVRGSLTGRGGHFIIIDEPLNPTDALSNIRRTNLKEWFDHTLYSRLNKKNRGAIVLITHRLHVDDLIAHVTEKEPWVHLNLPAIAEEAAKILIGENQFYERKTGEALHPEREPLTILGKIKKAIGTYHFSAQYQQAPIPPEGNLIHWEWFQFYEDLPPLESNDQVVQSWDTAFKTEDIHDYSVCTTWLQKDNRYFLIDIFRKRLDYPFLKRFIPEHARTHRTDVLLIEDHGSGIPLIQEMRHEGRLHPVPIQPKEDKIRRLIVQSAQIEAGRVFLPKAAPWLADFEAEILQFPSGKHDDQVDSMSQFLKWASRH